MGGIQIWKDVGRVSRQIKRYGTVVSCIGVWRTTAATSEAAATATATKKHPSTNTNLARKWLNHSTTIFLHGAKGAFHTKQLLARQLRLAAHGGG